MTKNSDGSPNSLRRAQEIGDRAAAKGFDWDDYHGPMSKIYEELSELEDVMANEGSDPGRLRDELGDILFSLVNLARHLEIDADEALWGTVRKFETRFASVEAALNKSGQAMEEMNIEELEDLWQKAKSR